METGATTVSLPELLAPVGLGLGLVEDRIARAIDTGQEVLTQAYTRMFAGGKRIRPALTLLAAGPQGSRKREVVALGAALEMLHTATLIHDDIIDGCTFRRGQATFCAEHGDDAAILAGDHLFARAAVVVTETRNLDALRVFAETLVTISAGELEQVWRHSRLPSLDEYLRLIHAKTACLFESAALGGALLAGREPQVVQRFAYYGRCVGLAFQIADDVLDYVGDPKVMGKPTLNDLQQGHMTLPALLYLWQLPEWERIEIPDGAAEEDVQPLVEAVIAGGFVGRALQMASDYSERAWEGVRELVSGPYADSLRGLARFAVERVA